MAPEPVTQTHGKSLSALGPLALALLLIIYAAGMLALPVYFFGFQAALWLSTALLTGGVSLLLVLAGANRSRQTAPESAAGACVVRATSPATQTWVPPRTIPFQ